LSQQDDSAAVANGALLLTERLALVSIKAEELLELAQQPDAFFLFRLRAPIVIENPSNNKWLFRRITLREGGGQIGLISFHGIPDDRGMVEVGFGIDPEYQNLGYGTEAVRALFGWAALQPEVQVLRYTVSATNRPSMRVIAKLGFTHVGQQIDEEDGPEEIFEMPASDFVKIAL